MSAELKKRVAELEQENRELKETLENMKSQLIKAINELLASRKKTW